jgi:ubiquitin C-terminal hydrolase
VGVVVHKGRSLEEGHYTAVVRRLDGAWWFCNDADVQPLAKPELVLNSRKGAYILLYQKEE